MSRRIELLHCGQQGLPLIGIFFPDHTVQQRFQHFADVRPRRDACRHQVAAIHSQLAVNGRDLMAAGIPAGPDIRKVLEALLDGVIREEYPNERQALLAAVQQLDAS